MLSMLLAGLPLANVDDLRPLLENGGALRQMNSSYVAQYIALILEEDEKHLNKAVSLWITLRLCFN